MVKCHGSQCGFCTPGIVMSLVNLVQTHAQPPADHRFAERQLVPLHRLQAPSSMRLPRPAPSPRPLKLDDSADVPLLKEIKRASVPT